MTRTDFACPLTTCGALTLAVLFTLLPIAARPAQAQTETVLYSFTNSPDGAIPTSSLISDGAGNFYGTTWNGGAEGWGSVFEFSPNGIGGWNEAVLYSFTNNGDGAGPFGGLVFDTASNLYGTTGGGGGMYGGGTVFELSFASGAWVETTLYSFCPAPGCKDGSEPWDNLIFDRSGNLYGTTRGGGAYGNFGVVFELVSNNGTWTEKVLHSFGKSKDGWNSFNSLVFDTAGNLYGVAEFGGAHGYGIVFELMPKANGKWVEKVLHSFNDNGKDGLYVSVRL
jgi:uncharacterized repeat protein (TIGR03803 family)